MIFLKDGFESFSTTTTVSTDEVAAKSANEWLTTIKDSMATLTDLGTTIKMRGAPPSFIAYDEAAYCNTTAPTTAWSDYGCSITELKVDRNDLNDALYLEQYGDNADESCCNSDDDYIGSLVEAQNQRLLAMEAIISTMQPHIDTLKTRVNSLECDLAFERRARWGVEDQLRCVETKVNEAKTNADYTRYAIADSMSRVGVLESTASGISSRVTVLEQMDSLAMPSKSFDDSADKRDQYVSWKLEPGKSSLHGAGHEISQDEILFAGGSHQATTASIPPNAYYSVDSNTGMVTVSAGKSACTLSIDPKTFRLKVTPGTVAKTIKIDPLTLPFAGI